MNCLSLLYLLFHLSVRVKQRRKGSLLTKEYCSDLISSSGPSFGASVLLLVGSSKGLVMEEETQMELEEGSYLQMLSIGEEEGHLLCLPSSLSSPASDSYSSHMLCFGGNEEDGFPFHGHVTQKSSDSSSMSSLSSSPTSTTISSSKLSKKKVESTCGDRRVASVTTSKKLKTNGSNGRGSTKVGKEKLGEQIMALHQLVSPFGKSDTASVLHEALGYIRFLHDQVQVLSSPYLQRLPSSAHLHFQEGIRRGGGEARITSDLRSRGLCLVPVSCTEHVANSNGADLWSPALAKNNISSSSTNH